MLEPLVKRSHPHRPNALVDQVAYGIIDARGDHPGSQAKTIREVRGDVELAPADVNFAIRRLAKRDEARVETMDQSSERY